MSHPRLELQLDWDVSTVQRGWPTGPDNFYILDRLARLVPEIAAGDGRGRVLEVAAAEAVHACRISQRGIPTVVVEPSEVMLERARERMAEHGVTVALVRGVAETLPFADRTFDRVLIDSAIDHLGRPDLSLAEMARVLQPDGRLIVTFVNYQSVSTRLSRAVYRAGRRLRLLSEHAHYFWDTPVPIEHTFECTYDTLRALCAPHLELDAVFGVSLGWMVPGWGALLRRLPRRRALAVLERLDRFAARRPRLADFVIATWKPRPDRPAGATLDPQALEPPDARPGGPLYASRAAAEADYWARTPFEGPIFALGRASARETNRAYTGDPARTWLDDLAARGPFERAAVLGCDEGGLERQWLARGGSARLDVYELSAGVIRKVRGGLDLATRRRARFRRADLNVRELPAQAYDVIWSSGCLHHLANLEHVFAQVARALRPGGLFAIRDYVGERRMRYDPARLARVNALLATVPARYRRTDVLTPPPLHALSPFCGVRSDAIVPLAEARFEVVHKGVAGALFPLYLAVDFEALEREAPEVLERLRAAEAEAQAAGVPPAGVYLVLRPRADAAGQRDRN